MCLRCVNASFRKLCKKGPQFLISCQWHGSKRRNLTEAKLKARIHFYQADVKERDWTTCVCARMARWLAYWDGWDGREGRWRALRSTCCPAARVPSPHSSLTSNRCPTQPVNVLGICVPDFCRSLNTIASSHGISNIRRWWHSQFYNQTTKSWWAWGYYVRLKSKFAA